MYYKEKPSTEKVRLRHGMEQWGGGDFRGVVRMVIMETD